jgi:hypothetical protein
MVIENNISFHTCMIVVRHIVSETELMKGRNIVRLQLSDIRHPEFWNGKILKENLPFLWSYF